MTLLVYRLVEAILVLAVALMLAVPGSGAAAQTATPASYPMTPDPAECVVAPVAIEEIVARLATPAAAVASPEPFAIPVGKPADAETAAAVVSTLRQVFACTNAGDFLRVYALFSEDFVRDFFAGTPLTDEVIAFLSAPPQPLPEEQRRMIRGIDEVQILADGRAGVLIVLDEPDDPRTEEPDYVILKRVDTRWLVDEIHEDPSLAMGTPQP